MDTGGIDALHPWQRPTFGSGLVLHGRLALEIDLPALRREFANLDAAVGPEDRNFLASDGSWAAIGLMRRILPAVDGSLRPGIPTPALAHMPSVAALLARAGWTAVDANILRQPPRGCLPWHFEPQGLHQLEARLLIPIHVPPDAVTLIGHERVAYPAGTGWTGDFAFPHQVENPGDEPRIVLALDVLTDEPVHRLLPAALAERVPERRQLAAEATNALVAWRNRPLNLS